MKPYFKEAHDFINSFQPISNAVFDTLYNSATYREIETGDKILELGVVPQKIFFITRGVIRSYLILQNGKEITTTLFNPLMFFASFKGLLKKKPSHLIYQALTNCHIFEIDYNDFYNLCKKDINLMALYVKFLEFIILRSEERFIEYSSNDAKQRYLLLRDRIPNIDNDIPQYQIAASLGITPVQLSRIRAKL
ncbi:Crp/Fnr family transcriptional regulator [Lacinutrix chionoecetis]